MLDLKSSNSPLILVPDPTLTHSLISNDFCKRGITVDTANLSVEPLLCSSMTKYIEAEISGFYSMGKIVDKNKEELCRYLNQAPEKNLERGKIVEILRYSQHPMTDEI